jgi:hypothetical protein
LAVKRQPTHGAGSNKLNEISGADFIKPAPLNYLAQLKSGVENVIN